MKIIGNEPLANMQIVFYTHLGESMKIFVFYRRMAEIPQPVSECKLIFVAKSGEYVIMKP